MTAATVTGWRRRLLVAFIVLLPATVVAVVVTVKRSDDRRVHPAADPAASPTVLAVAPEPDYEVRASLLPVRTAAVDVALTIDQLPSPADCEAVYTWAAARGDATVNIGRVDLRLAAHRLVQIGVEGVTVAVKKERFSTAQTILQCDTSDYRKNWEPLPGDVKFTEGLAVHGEDYFTEAPVVMLDLDTDDPLPVVFDTPPEDLSDKLMTVDPGGEVRLPFYVIRDGARVSDSDIAVLTVEIAFTVNNVPVKHKVEFRMHLLHETPPAATRLAWLTDQRRWVKDRVFDPAKAAPRPRGGSYLCETFADADVAPILGNRVEIASYFAGDCIWKAVDGRRQLSLYYTRHVDETAAREDYRHQIANTGSVEGVKTTPVSGLGDEAAVLSSGMLYARRGRDMIVMLCDPPPNGQAVVTLARIAAAKLFTKPEP